MNSVISTAVSRGWIRFPEPVARQKRVEAPPINIKLAQKLWNEGQSLDYVSKAIGVRRSVARVIVSDRRRR